MLEENTIRKLWNFQLIKTQCMDRDSTENAKRIKFFFFLKINYIYRSLLMPQDKQDIPIFGSFFLEIFHHPDY